MFNVAKILSLSILQPQKLKILTLHIFPTSIAQYLEVVDNKGVITQVHFVAVGMQAEAKLQALATLEGAREEECLQEAKEIQLLRPRKDKILRLSHQQPKCEVTIFLNPRYNVTDVDLWAIQRQIVKSEKKDDGWKVCYL